MSQGSMEAYYYGGLLFKMPLEFYGGSNAFSNLPCNQCSLRFCSDLHFSNLCNHCDSDFAHRQTLNRHMRIPQNDLKFSHQFVLGFCSMFQIHRIIVTRILLIDKLLRDTFKYFGMI